MNEMLFGAEASNVNISTQASQEGERNMQRVSNSGAGFIDFGALLNKGMDAATNVLKTFNAEEHAKNISEANAAKVKAIQVKTSSEYLEGSAKQRVRMLQREYQEAAYRSPSYRDAMASYTASDYQKEYLNNESDIDTAYYNSTGAAYVAWLSQKSEAGKVDLVKGKDGKLTSEVSGKTNQQTKTANDFVEEFVASSGRKLDKTKVGRGVIGEVYKQKVEAIKGIKNEDELIDINNYFKELEAPLQTPQFLGTTSSEGVAYINELESEVKSTIKNKQAEFLYNYRSQFADIQNKGNMAVPDKVNPIIDRIYSNPVERENIKRKYYKDHTERINADAFNDKYAIGERGEALLPDNPTLKKERQAATTQELYKSLANNDIEQFVKIAKSEHDMIKEAGDSFMAAFYNANDAKGAQAILSKFNQIRSQPDGSFVLKQLLTDEEFTRMSAINATLIAHPEMTVPEARNFVYTAEQTVSKVVVDEKKIRKIYDLSHELGTSSKDFMLFMEHQIKINPTIAEADFKKVHKMFKDQESKDTEGKKVNTTMGINPAKSTKVMSEEAVDTIINSKLGNGIEQKDFVGTSLVVGRDALGGIQKVINIAASRDDDGNIISNSIIDAANEKTIKELEKSKQEHIAQINGEDGNVSKAYHKSVDTIKSVTRDIIDNSIPGVGNYISKVFSNIVDDISFEFSLDEQTAKEVIVREIDDKINELNTSKGTEGLTNSPYKGVELDAFNLRLDQNKKDMNKLIDNKPSSVSSLNKYDKYIITNEGTKIDKNGKHIEYASPEDGNNTIGYGHKLTEDEIKSGKIHGIDYKKGLTNQQATAIYLADKDRLTKKLGIDDLSENLQFLAADVAMRLGDISNTKFLEALKEGNLAKAFVHTGSIYWTDKNGKHNFYDNRHFSIFQHAGLKITPALRSAYEAEQYNTFKK